MDLTFRYSCNCKEQHNLSYNRSVDNDYNRRLSEYNNDIIDHAWDGEDTETLSLMIAIINALQNSNDSNENFITSNMNLMPIRKNMDVAIIKTCCNQAPNYCICEAITSQVSIVLQAGLCELCIEPFNEEQLLEKLQLVKPFVGMFEKDRVVENFFVRCWKLAIRHYSPKLIGALTFVYPQFIKSLIDALIECNQKDSMLTCRKEFKYLSQCLTVSSSFYIILSYLAEKNLNDVQHLISACITFAKAELPSALYCALFPLHLRPYAVIINEMISLQDPNILILIEDLRISHPTDYKILLISFPVLFSLMFNNNK